MDIFEAAWTGNVKALEACLKAEELDLRAENANGFTALHCAAVACNRVNEETAVALVKMLIERGAPVNWPARDGRTVLFLAAEFSHWLEPIKMLVAAGANPNIRNGGVHIVMNANAPAVQTYLSELTGHPIPPPRVQMKSIKMTAADWRGAKAKMDPIFAALAKDLVVLQDAGTTQEDGFSDCSEEFRARGGSDAGLRGFCFYTRQDLNRAKRSSQLCLAFWGAPDGTDEAMVDVGERVVNAFREGGFTVDWSGSPKTRPILFLKAE
jgi:bifunctional non-homologous end joining protein LigD